MARDLEKQKVANKKWREANKEYTAKQQKEWKEKNKEKHKQKRREYAERNKEHIAEQQKEYRKANKEHIKKLNDEWREKNKEKHKKQQKEYREANLDKCLKRERMRSWKRQGLNETEEEIEEIYERYYNTTHCDCCNIEFSLENNMDGKSMDHNHKNGKFRNVLCKRCNNMRYFIDERYTHLIKLMSM